MKHRVEKFLWLNVTVDSEDKSVAEVELKYEHGTDKEVVIHLLKESLKQLEANNFEVDHTHESREGVSDNEV